MTWHQIARAWDAGTVRVQDPDTRRPVERFTLDDGTRCTVMEAVADPRNVHGLSRNTIYKRLVDRGWREADRLWDRSDPTRRRRRNG
jgi:hypothetical protein